MMLVVRYNTLNNSMIPVVVLPKDEAIALVNQKNKEISSMVYGFLNVDELKACLEGVV